MQIILNKDVKHLGRRGDIVNVKNGYFRNFLFPNNLAEMATKARLKVAEARLAERVKKMEEMKEKYTEVQASLEGKSFTFKAKTTGKDTLYKAVSEQDVIELVKADMKLELEASSIKFAEHIKTLGEHDVTVHLAEGVEATIKLTVEADA